METRLADFIKDTPEGREADAILRACVHCGFCTATCPTYQLLGDELDGPRGRIYLIKQMLEGAAGDRKHATAPRSLSDLPQLRNDVSFRRALRSPGRHRPPGRRAESRPQRQASGDALAAAQGADASGAVRCGARGRPPRASACFRARLPRKSPRRRAAKSWPTPRHARRMLVLDGCVQPALTPSIDAALARVLDRIGISLVRAAGGGCCGAISEHLGAHDEALDYVRRNIDAWWPHVEQGAEAILVVGERLRRRGQGLRLLAARRRATMPTRRSGSPNLLAIRWRSSPQNGSTLRRWSRWIMGHSASRSSRRARCSMGSNSVAESRKSSRPSGSN